MGFKKKSARGLLEKVKLGAGGGGGETGIEEGMLFFTGWTSCVSIWRLELGSHLMIPGIQPEDQATYRSWRSRRTERI